MVKQVKGILPMILLFIFTFIALVPTVDVKAQEQENLNFQDPGAPVEDTILPAGTNLNDYIETKKEEFLANIDQELYVISTSQMDSYFKVNSGIGTYGVFTEINTETNEVVFELHEVSVETVETIKIKSISLTVAGPNVGSKITEESEPTITLESGANYFVSYSMYINNYPSVDESYDSGAIFGTTVEAGKYYYYEVYLAPKSGYEFDENFTLKVNGKTTDYELSDYFDPTSQLAFFGRVKAGESSGESSTTDATVVETTYAVLDGENQVFDAKSGEKLTFRFDIDYADFLASGEVYMDGVLVDPSNYTTKEGSTYVIFNESYTKKLANGSHTMKVKTDNGEASVSFSIVNGTNNPNTADNIYLSIIMLIVSLVGLGSTIIYSRKKITI